MKLTELLQGIVADSIPMLEINAITDDSRKACENALFVCISGALFDGHSYAQAAYKNGCRAFVVQKEVRLPSDAYVCRVLDTRAALAGLACRFYGNPSHKMRLFGITGTKGKTTTAQLIAHLLNSSGIPCGYIGTSGIDYLDHHEVTQNTTPDPLTLQKTLADMLRCGVSSAVLEVSSQGLVQHRADGIIFDTLIYTNIAPDHIGAGEHADFTDYLLAKKRLFTDFCAKNIVYWKDDAHAHEIVTPTHPTRMIGVSKQDKDAEYQIKSVSPDRCNGRFGVRFELEAFQKSIFGTLPMLGEFNVHNVTLATAAISAAYDLPPEEILRYTSCASVAGRSEQLLLPIGAVVCIDYAHNPFSLQRLLSSLHEFSHRKLYVLFGSVGERTKLRRREMGEVAAKYADYAVLTSDNPGNEPPEDIIADIAQGFAPFDTPFVSIPDRKEAILHALGLLQNGDVLVLAGKGHENYQLIGQKKLPFCEKQIVTEYLSAQKKTDPLPTV